MLARANPVMQQFEVDEVEDCFVMGQAQVAVKGVFVMWLGTTAWVSSPSNISVMSCKVLKRSISTTCNCWCTCEWMLCGHVDLFAHATS